MALAVQSRCSEGGKWPRKPPVSCTAGAVRGGRSCLRFQCPWWWASMGHLRLGRLRPPQPTSLSAPAHRLTSSQSFQTERGRGGEATARRALRDCTAALGASPRRLASEEVRIGETATELAQVADEVGAGLIVLGTSHRTGLAQVLLGTTLGSLLERAPFPLLIIPGGRSRLAVVSSGDWRRCNRGVAPGRRHCVGDRRTLRS